MKMTIENLGPIEYAEINIGNFTILCGSNNTGKTYITYAFYGFLFFWERYFKLKISSEYAQSLLKDGVVNININEIIKHSSSLFERASTEYTKFLPRIFAQNAAKFEKTRIKYEITPDEITPTDAKTINFGSDSNIFFRAKKDQNNNSIEVTLLINRDKLKLKESSVNEAMDIIIKKFIFSSVLPSYFIASTERTGAITFINELDIKKNIYIRELSNRSDNEINPFEIEESVSISYPLPIRDDISFNRKISSLVGVDGFISKLHPEIVDFYNNMLSGAFVFGRDRRLFFKTKGKKLDIIEVSSSIRSLIDIGMYLRYASRPFDFLIIDEPELNLHPENQRKIARLIIRLVNIGIKVFITTHSDYIIKEINNSILMKNHYSDKIPDYLKKYGYTKDDLIDYKKLKVYKTHQDLILMPGRSRKSRKRTVLPMRISEKTGIQAETFDAVINEMNDIQDYILYKEE